MSRVPIRYLPWMLRDVLFAQGTVLFVTSAMIWLIWSRVSPAPPPSAGPGLVRTIVMQIGWPFILYCSAAFVSTDRIQGYYRSIFSRPVAPPWYYLQRWLVGAVVVGLVVPMLTLALTLALGGFPLSGALVARLEMTYLLVGGLTFLISTVVRADWLIALLILILQNVLSGLRSEPGLELPAFWDLIYRILPPFHLVNANSPSLTGPQLTHVLLYGAGLVLGALAVLRWRPLGAGGRA